MNRWLLRCAGYGLAFVIFLNTDQSNSEDVALRMPGLARQVVRVVYATERASPWLDDNIMRYVNNPVGGRGCFCAVQAPSPMAEPP